MANAIANSWAFWIAIITVLAAVWASPIIIGLARHAQPIIVVILLCMFPILWPAALIGAFMLPRKADSYRPVVGRLPVRFGVRSHARGRMGWQNT